MKTLEERFLDKVNKTESCWFWTGGKLPKGYGRFSIKHGVSIYAHRYAYMKYVGPLETKLFVLHSCDNPSCVNPKHLWSGTHQDNMRDASNKHRGKFGKIGVWDVKALKIKKVKWSLTPIQRAAVKDLGKIYSTRAVSLITGVSKSHVHHLLSQ